MFGLGIVLFSVWVAYHWGIKPDREEQKRRAERALGELRQQARKSRQRLNDPSQQPLSLSLVGFVDPTPIPFQSVLSLWQQLSCGWLEAAKSLLLDCIFSDATLIR